MDSPESMQQNTPSPIRTILFYVALCLTTIFAGSLCVILHRFTGGNEWPHLCARLWGRMNLWAAGVRVHISGLHNIDRHGTYIYAANHQGWFDIFALLAWLPVQFRYLAKEELFRIPFLGPAMTATGYIPIDRGDHRKAFRSLNVAAFKVRCGTSVLIFPEGTRSRDGVLQEFKKGGFILAVKSGQPVVPISISGSHHVFPKEEGWMIRPGAIRITVGKPVATAHYAQKDKDVLLTAVRDAIRLHLPREEGGLEEPLSAAVR